MPQHDHHHTVDIPELAKGVPYSEITRFVAEANPALIEALEKASREYHRHEDTWQEEAARHQRNAGMPRRRVESSHGRALRETGGGGRLGAGGGRAGGGPASGEKRNLS